MHHMNTRRLARWTHAALLVPSVVAAQSGTGQICLEGLLGLQNISTAQQQTSTKENFKQMMWV